MGVWIKAEVMDGGAGIVGGGGVDADQKLSRSAHNGIMGLKPLC